MNKPTNSLVTNRHYAGRVRMAHVAPDMQPSAWRYLVNQHNDLTTDFGTILQRLLRAADDGYNYHIGGMYVEFDNSGGAVTPPAIDPENSLDYYANLAAPQDYLRVPLIAASETTVGSGYALPNSGLISAVTTGSQGIHGLPFSAASNSRIFGAALVVFRDPEDASKDLVYARAYLEVADQQLQKLANSQIGLTWDFAFRLEGY